MRRVINDLRKSKDYEYVGKPDNVSKVGLCSIERMACGIGACLCCVEDTADQGNVCVCKEGPVFEIDRLKWFN